MSRADICKSAANKIRNSQSHLRSVRAVIGLDGFVDSIIDVVDQRDSFEKYSAITTIDAFGRKIVAAAGKSANYEFVVKNRKLGGNGPIFANALAIAGLDIDYIGSLGTPVPDPVFAEFATRARLYSLCQAGSTDALEFTDGKLLLGKITHLSEVNWSNLCKLIGLDKFTAMCEAADLIAMNNWTMIPYMGDIWAHVATDVLPKLSKRKRRIFIDLADPEKRTAADLRRDLGTLTIMQKFAEVTLGVNLKEAGQVANVLGVRPPTDTDSDIQQAAAGIREKLGLSATIIHPRRGAGGADANSTAWVDGPMVKQPKLSTGAGDNFNAGYCLGELVGGTLEESLACGCASSGYYVREAGSATAGDLADFLENLPVSE